jgi:outer membrane lipoprotein
MWRSVIVLMVILLTGCQAMLPTQLRGDVTFVGTPTDAVTDWDSAQGQYVRWGGLVAKVKVRKQATWVEIVALPLEASGRPKRTDASEGRFIARIPGLLDPIIYRRGREITVYGRLTKTFDGKIGEQAYTYPVLDVVGHQLWPKRREVSKEIYIIPSYWGGYWHPHIWPRPVHVLPKTTPRSTPEKNEK